jgi:hypothetical protein
VKPAVHGLPSYDFFCLWVAMNLLQGKCSVVFKSLRPYGAGRDANTA